MPRVQALLGRQIGEQRVGPPALQRDRLEPAVAVPAQHPRQQPAAHAAVGVVEEHPAAPVAAAPSALGLRRGGAPASRASITRIIAG